MTLQVNYWAVVVVAIVNMIIGTIWYGPFFAKQWMVVMGVDPNDKAKMQAINKNMNGMYILSFLGRWSGPG